MSESIPPMATTREQRLIAGLRAARLAIGWTQGELAKAAGVGTVTVARMEAGLMSPRLSTLSKLQDTLEAAGVLIHANDPPGGASVVLSPRAILESRRRYEEARRHRSQGQGSDASTGGTSAHRRETRGSSKGDEP